MATRKRGLQFHHPRRLNNFSSETPQEIVQHRSKKKTGPKMSHSALHACLNCPISCLRVLRTSVLGLPASGPRCSRLCCLCSKNLQGLLHESLRRRTGYWCVLHVLPSPCVHLRRCAFRFSPIDAASRLFDCSTQRTGTLKTSCDLVLVQSIPAALRSCQTCPRLHPPVPARSTPGDRALKKFDILNSQSRAIRAIEAVGQHLLAERELHVPAHVSACLDLCLCCLWTQSGFIQVISHFVDSLRQYLEASFVCGHLSYSCGHLLSGGHPSLCQPDCSQSPTLRHHAWWTCNDSFLEPNRESPVITRPDVLVPDNLGQNCWWRHTENLKTHVG